MVKSMMRRWCRFCGQHATYFPGPAVLLYAVCQCFIPAACVWLFLDLPGLGWAQPGDSTDLVSRVRELVADLDHRQLARREAAEKELLQLGPDILPLLPPIDNRMPAEMRQRLLRVVSVLQVRTAQQTIAPTKVSYEGAKSINELLEIITKQTGNALSEAPNATRVVEVAWKDVPFWAAVDELLDAGQLTVELIADQSNVLTLAARPSGWSSRREHVVYVGPFRLQPLRLTAVRDLRNAGGSHLRLAMELSWEPRLSPLAISYALRDIQAEDDQKRPLIDPMIQGEPEIPVHAGMSGVEWEIPLLLPDREARQIAFVRGKLTVLLPSRFEGFVFERDLAAARQVVQRKAGVAVILDEVRQSGDVYQVRMRVRFDEAAGALESHRGWIFQNEAYLLDPQGERLENLGMEVTRQEENEVGVAYLFDRPEGLQGCKFVYKTPILLLRHDVDYEITGLPLP